MGVFNCHQLAKSSGVHREMEPDPLQACSEAYLLLAMEAGGNTPFQRDHKEHSYVSYKGFFISVDGWDAVFYFGF